MSFLIQKDELTLTDMRNFRAEAEEAGVARAMQKLTRTRKELLVRAFENVLDAGTATEQWNTAPLLLINTPYSVFTLAVPAFALANNKVAVFYKVGVETLPFPVSLLTFRKGGAAGNIKAEFDLEQLVNGNTLEGYFSEPVVYDPTDLIAIQVTSRLATGVLARVQLGAWIVEPVGQRIA